MREGEVCRLATVCIGIPVLHTWVLSSGVSLFMNFLALCILYISLSWSEAYISFKVDIQITMLYMYISCMFTNNGHIHVHVSPCHNGYFEWGTTSLHTYADKVYVHVQVHCCTSCSDGGGLGHSSSRVRRLAGSLSERRVR